MSNTASKNFILSSNFCRCFYFKKRLPVVTGFLFIRLRTLPGVYNERLGFYVVMEKLCFLILEKFQPRLTDYSLSFMKKVIEKVKSIEKFRLASLINWINSCFWSCSCCWKLFSNPKTLREISFQSYFRDWNCFEGNLKVEARDFKAVILLRVNF